MGGTVNMAGGSMIVDPFVLEHVFNVMTLEDGSTAYWREVVGGSEGYILLWEDGSHFHTYRCPEDWLE